MNEIELYENYIKAHTKEELELAWVDMEFVSDNELSPIANFIAYNKWWQESITKILNKQ